MTYYNWLGYTGPQAEPIAEARLVEASRAVLGNQLPTPALICAALAELLRGGIGVGSGSVSGFYSPSANSVPSDGSTDATAAMGTFVTNVVPATGGPYYVVLSPGETYAFASDYTFPANVKVYSLGGTVKPASTKTVTFAVEPFSTGPLLNSAAAGTLAFAGAFRIKPSWFGLDPTGTADFSAGREKMTASILTANNGGYFDFPGGTISMDDQGSQFSANYGGTTVAGQGYSTLFQNRIKRTNAGGDFRGLFGFYGGGRYALSHLELKDFLMRGVDTGDCATPIIIDQAEEVVMDNVYFENWGIECVRALSGTDVRRFTATRIFAKNCGLARTGGVLNIGASETIISDSRFNNCSVALETASFYTSIQNCQFKDMTQWGVMVFSTWSGYLDSLNSYAQVNALGASIIGCEFINIPDRAILLPDFTGHTNADGGHPSPAHIDGNKGQVLIQGCLFDRCSIATWGGADLKGTVDFSQNLISGQWTGGGLAFQTIALSPEGGTWNIHHNTWQKGEGYGFSGLLFGNAYVGGKQDRMAVYDNTVINNPCNSDMFIGFYKDTFARTRFIDLDGTIGAGANQRMYNTRDSNNPSVLLNQLKVNEWAWWDTDHQISHVTEPNRIPVLGDTLPSLFTFKPGDILVNRLNAVRWNTKRCFIGGTIDPTPLTQTATGSNGATTITVSAVIPGDIYRYINFPSIPAITNKRIIGGFGTTTLTLETALEAAVPGGTAVAWAAPSFVSDIDIKYNTITGQSIGDMYFADSTTTNTRLPVATNGYYLGTAAGLPTWLDATPRYDAGNKTGAFSMLRTPERQEQKATLIGNATMTIDVSTIPSGGYLVTDIYQDATGGRTLAFAVSAGSLSWVNGGAAPTMTPTLNKYDRFIFHNNGTSALQAWAAFQNAA